MRNPIFAIMVLAACQRPFTRLDALKGPSAVHYAAASFAFIVGQPVPAATPTVAGSRPTLYVVSPSLPPGVSIDPSTGEISGTPAQLTSQRDYVITASNVDGSTTTTLTIIVSEAPPTTLAYSFPNAVYAKNRGIAQNTPVSTGGTPTQYAVQPALPAGLTLDPRTGAIFGSAGARALPSDYLVTASNSAGSVTTTLHFEVTDTPPELSFSGSPFVLALGSAFNSQAPNNQGGTITSCTGVALPSWMQVNSTTCAVTGVPSASLSDAAFTLDVGYDGGHTTATFTLGVRDTLRLLPASATLTAGRSRQVTFAAQGGVPPYAYEIAAGPGSINRTSGVFTTPVQPGETTVVCRDARNIAVTAPINIQSLLANGAVNQVAAANGTLYLAGDFDALHPASAPNFAVVDTTTGELDTSLDLQDGFDGPVRALLKVGNAYFVAGQFGRYRGQQVGSLVKIDATTGELASDFNRLPGLAAPANAAILLATDGTSLYVAGALQSYRAQPVSHILRLALSDGSQQLFADRLTDGEYDALAVAGDDVYLAGAIDSDDDSSIDTYLVRLDKHTGTVNGTVATSDRVRALAVSATAVYVGGGFTAVLGEARNRVAALSIADHTLLPFAASLPWSAGVQSLDMGGNGLWIASGDSNLAQVARVHPDTGAAQSIISGLTTDDGGSGTFNDQLYLVVRADGTGAAVGGNFRSVAAASRRGVARFDANGMLLGGVSDRGMVRKIPANQSNTPRVYAVLPDGTRLLAGGEFWLYGGDATPPLAHLDLFATGIDTAFRDSVAPLFGSSSKVTALRYANDALYVGMQSGASCNGLLKRTTAGAAATGFPCVPVGGIGLIFAIEATAADVFIGGVFSSVTTNLSPAQNLAQLSVVDGTLRNTIIQAGASGGVAGTVHALRTDFNGQLWIGGDIANYRGAAMTHGSLILTNLLRVSLTDGARDGSQSFTMNSQVTTIETAPGYLYLGGLFDQLSFDQTFSPCCVSAPCARPAYGLAVITVPGYSELPQFNYYDATTCNSTGLKLHWSDGSDPHAWVFGLVADSASQALYLGGRFDSADDRQTPNAPVVGLTRSGLYNGLISPAYSPLAAGPKYSTQSQDSFQVSTLTQAAVGIFAGGNITTYRGEPAAYAVLVDGLSGAALR